MGQSGEGGAGGETRRSHPNSDSGSSKGHRRCSDLPGLPRGVHQQLAATFTGLVVGVGFTPFGGLVVGARFRLGVYTLW